MSKLNGRDIPGYYYDSQKNKYFKIQKNHAALPGSKYTSEKVARIREQSEKDLAQTSRARETKAQRVQRARISTPFAGTAFARELNLFPLQGQTREIHAHVYGKGFCVGEEIFHSAYSINACAWVPTTREVMLGIEATTMSDSSIFLISPGKRKRKNLLTRTRDNMTSFTTGPNGTYCYTTLGTEDASVVYFSKLPGVGHSNQHRMQESSSTSLYFDGSAFTSAANPFRTDKSLFAIGSTEKALLVQYNAVSDDISTTSLKISGDTLATEWLDANTLALGQRSGRIVLWDIRSGGHSSRLQHPSCINGIRRVDSQKMIVGGLQHQLALYDLRMPARLLPKSLQTTAKQKQRHRGSHGVSRPLLQYEYGNKYMKLGFDLSVDNGILAAGDDSDFVNVFSINTGELVNRFLPVQRKTEDDVYTERYPVSYLKFCVGQDSEEFLLGTSGRKLWASTWSTGPVDNRVSLERPLGDEYYFQ